VLTTAYITDPDLNKAANELLTNAERLVVAGRFSDARLVLDMLSTPGAWMLRKHGNVVQKLQRIAAAVSYLCDIGCPAIGQAPAKSREEIAAWAEDAAERFLRALAMPIRHQGGPAGLDWTEANLASLADVPDPTARAKAFSDFCVDAEFVLKGRLAADSQLGSGLHALNILMKPFDQGASAAVDLDLTQLMTQLAAIQVAEPARLMPTIAIGATAAKYLRQTNTPGNFMTSFIFQAVTVLCLRDGLTDGAADAAGWLAGSDGRLDLITMATVRPVRELLAGGACASSAGIDDAAVAAYLSAMRRRPQFSKPGIAASPFMIDSVQSFAQHFVGTPLAGRRLFELPILETPEKAYAVEAPLGDMVELWRTARELVAQTGRWPVITTWWSNGGLSGSEARCGEDLFSRFYFEEAPNAEDVSPRALVAAADSIVPAEFIKRMEQQRDQQRADYADFDEHIAYELGETARRCGAAPSRDDVNEARLGGRAIGTAYQLDRWLLDWEQAHGGSRDPDMARQEGFEQEPVFLVFLPTPNCWDALAYINWYGTSDFGSENYIALGRAWQKRFGAELFAHFGTVLECFVTRPPVTVQDAWELAQQHDLAASCTLGGIALRCYATDLMTADRWFLHERP
jgi:hypothetical protein